MIGGCSAGASTAMKRVGITTLALWLALTGARLPAVQSAPRLALELQDHAALPITAENTDANTRAQLARVNFLPALGAMFSSSSGTCLHFGFP